SACFLPQRRNMRVLLRWSGIPHTLASSRSTVTCFRRNHNTAPANADTRKPWEYCGVFDHLSAKETNVGQKAQRKQATEPPASRKARERSRERTASSCFRIPSLSGEVFRRCQSFPRMHVGGRIAKAMPARSANTESEMFGCNHSLSRALQ